MIFVTEIAFAGEEPGCDPQAAATALRGRGYEVRFMSPSERAKVGFCHPLDEVIEAGFYMDTPGNGRDDDGELTPAASKIMAATMPEIDTLANRYGGCVMDRGPIEADYYVPFEEQPE
jgi:hypothetical protein